MSCFLRMSKVKVQKKWISRLFKIEGTAGWYYNKWPGFLSVDAYRIMEAYSNGEDIDEYVLRNRMIRVKKRKVDNDVFLESIERNDETSSPVR